MGAASPMTCTEWREAFARLPEPTREELAKFVERRRAEDAREMREFEEKWEGRVVKGNVNTEARRHGDAEG